MNESAMNMVCFERVCYEHDYVIGSLMNRSVLNGSFMNMVCCEVVSYERGLL